MLQNFRNLLLRILFRLLDGPITDYRPDEKQMELIRRWMRESYADPGYQAWMKYRDGKLARELSTLGMEAMPRDKYVRVIGQRFEFLRQDDLFRKVFNAKSRADRERNDKDIQN